MRFHRCLWVLLGASGIAAASLAATPESFPKSACAPSPTTLCLLDGRFSVSATWQKSDGSNGHGNAVLLTDDTGYFWFFDPASIEVVTKALNGCAINDEYWIFSSGLTNVGVSLTVTDLATGQSKNYANPVDTPYAVVEDTRAFATCATPTPHVADVNGTWAANLTVNGSIYPATFTLLQTGSTVSGTASVFGGGGGSMTGAIDGQTLHFSVAA